MFTQTLPAILPRFSFAWSPLVGAYDCVDERGRRHETMLSCCSCASSVCTPAPCVHALELLALAEDGAITDGPLGPDWDETRHRRLQEAVVEEITSRAWDYVLESPAPEDTQRCGLCGRDTGRPLVSGWATFCGECLKEAT